MENELKRNSEEYRHIYSRAAVNGVGEVKEDYSFYNVVATQRPVIVWDWYRWEPIREILLFKEAGYPGLEAPKGNQLILLDNHTRYSTSNVIGSTRELDIKVDDVLNELVYAGKSIIDESAPRERSLVKNKHLKDTSMGYRTYDEEGLTVWLMRGESETINGVNYSNNYEDGLPFAIRLKMTPTENSLTPIGADKVSGFRSAFKNESSTKIFLPENIEPKLADEIRKANNEVTFEIKPKQNKGDVKMGDELKPLVLDEKVRVEIQDMVKGALGIYSDQLKEERSNEESRRASILALANDEDMKKNLPGVNLRTEAQPFLDDLTKRSEDFKDKVLELMKETEPHRRNADEPLSDKENKSYSLSNIVRYQLGSVGEDAVGLELEYSRNEAKERKISLKEKEFLLPQSVMNRRTKIRFSTLSGREKEMLFGRDELRALVTGTPSKGGVLVRDEYTSFSFIELLTAAMVLTRSGMEVFTGLHGNIPISREVDELQYFHGEEGVDIGETDLTFAEESMNPNKAGARVRISYEFLNMSPFAAEIYMERKLAGRCGRGFQKDIIYGTGVKQPKGLKNWTGVGYVDGTNFSRAKALAMIAQIEDADADDGSLKFISRPSTRTALKAKEDFANSGRPLVSDANALVGEDYGLASNIFTAGDLFYGNWNQLIAGYWDQLRINSSEHVYFNSGDIAVRALQFVDSFNKNPGAFSHADNVA